MTTRLKETDVVIIGLGAAGGVAALPLAQAGLEVIGLEAGAWLTRRDFAPAILKEVVSSHSLRRPADPSAAPSSAARSRVQPRCASPCHKI